MLGLGLQISQTTNCIYIKICTINNIKVYTFILSKDNQIHRTRRTGLTAATYEMTKKKNIFKTSVRASDNETITQVIDTNYNKHIL